MKLYQAYWSPFPTRVRLLIYVKGLDVEFVEPSMLPAQSMAKGGFQGVGSIGRIPALELDDGRLLAESEVICEYLEDAFPERSLRPNDPWQLAQVRLLSRISDIYVVMAMVPLFNAAGLPRAQRSQEKIDAAMAQLAEALNLLEQHIGTEGYAVGKTLSQADGALIPILLLVSAWAPNLFDVANPLLKLPRLTGYWEAIAKDPIAKRLIEETLTAIRERRSKANGQT